MIVSGIYAIYCQEASLVYIGSSSNIKQRFSNHKCKLKVNSHKCRNLQRVVNMYGMASLRFVILEECCKNGMLRKEQYWIVAGKQLSELLVANKNASYSKRIGKRDSKVIKDRVYQIEKLVQEHAASLNAN